MAMIALVPDDPDILALDGGIPVGELHCTLAYLGSDENEEWSDELKTALMKRVARMSQEYGPITLEVFGHAAWSTHKGTEATLYQLKNTSTVDMLQIECRHSGLDLLGSVRMPEPHSQYLPHVTVAKGSEPERLDYLGPMPFSKIRLTVGGTTFDFPLTGHNYENEDTGIGLARPTLERAPGKKDNWVEASGGLPKYIDRIARALHQDQGMTVQRAIATAISRVKKWAAGGKGVTPQTQQQAARAVAQWEGLKAKARSKKVDNAADPILVGELLLTQQHAELVELAAKHTKQYGKAKGNLAKKGSWKHGYDPQTDTAVALKAKHLNKERDLTKSGAVKPTKASRLHMPVPPHLQSSKTDQQRSATKRAAQGMGKPKAKAPAPPKLGEGTRTAAQLKARRAALQKKVAAGTATPADRAALNKVITQLKKKA
jgi:2'-5' RNA ligase